MECVHSADDVHSIDAHINCECSPATLYLQSPECVSSALIQPMYDGCGFYQQGVFSNSTKISALKRKTFSHKQLFLLI